MQIVKLNKKWQQGNSSFFCVAGAIKRLLFQSTRECSSKPSCSHGAWAALLKNNPKQFLSFVGKAQTRQVHPKCPSPGATLEAPVAPPHIFLYVPPLACIQHGCQICRLLLLAAYDMRARQPHFIRCKNNESEWIDQKATKRCPVFDCLHVVGNCQGKGTERLRTGPLI